MRVRRRYLLEMKLFGVIASGPGIQSTILANLIDFVPDSFMLI